MWYVAKGFREDQITKIPLSVALVSLQDYLRYVAKGFREDQITKIPLSVALVSLQDYLRFQF